MVQLATGSEPHDRCRPVAGRRAFPPGDESCRDRYHGGQAFPFSRRGRREGEDRDGRGIEGYRR
jgi:hypothetical protein